MLARLHRQLCRQPFRFLLRSSFCRVASVKEAVMVANQERERIESCRPHLLDMATFLGRNVGTFFMPRPGICDRYLCFRVHLSSNNGCSEAFWARFRPLIRLGSCATLGRFQANVYRRAGFPDPFFLTNSGQLYSMVLVWTGVLLWQPPSCFLPSMDPCRPYSPCPLAFAAPSSVARIHNSAPRSHTRGIPNRLGFYAEKLKDTWEGGRATRVAPRAPLTEPCCRVWQGRTEQKAPKLASFPD